MMRLTSYALRLTLIILVPCTLCLAPSNVAPSIHHYTPAHSLLSYSPEYYKKRQVKDFILICAYPRVTVQEAWGLAACLVDQEEAYGLQHGLAAAVAMVESRFNYLKINGMNCWGMMQVRPSTGSRDVWEKELKEAGIIKNVSDLLIPEINARAGCYILAKYIRLYGDLPTVLTRYSGSTQPVNKDYVNQIMDAMEYFKEG